MLARKTAIAAPEAAPERFEANAPLIERMPSVRPASQFDAATASPVHVMQARLEWEMKDERNPTGIDWMKPVVLVVNGLCWWAMIRLGIAFVHNWPFH